MKKFLYFAMAVAASFAMFSCGSKTTAVDVTGAWDVTAVAGEEIALPDSLLCEAPFVVFDAETGSLSGYTGCNHIVATSYTVAGDSLKIQAPIAITMMAGPQPLMVVESKVLNALNNAVTVKAGEEGTVEVCDAEGTVVMVLSPRAEEAEEVTEEAADSLAAPADSLAEAPAETPAE